MSPEKLAYMANQIARFFTHQTHAQAVASVEDHIRKFWDPRMRREIVASLDDGQTKLDPVVKEAVARLHDSQVA